MSNAFERSGLASCSDLKTTDWSDLFSALEAEQSFFLRHEVAFRSPEYRWPRDPLHSWSRAWEYPYAYHHLRAWRRANPARPLLRAADIGSGVTFFPFSVAKLGYAVTCVDVDPVCGRDLARAARCVAHTPGSVDFKLINGSGIPLEDGGCDAAFCISVLEHVPHPDQTLAEIARILKPGGLFVLTIDIDLRGDAALGAPARERLIGELRKFFDPISPSGTIHPADMLTSINARYPMAPVPFLRLPFALWRRFKFRHAGLPGPIRTPAHLAVEGSTWRKRQTAPWQEST